MKVLLVILAFAAIGEAQTPPATPGSQGLAFGVLGLSTNQVARLHAVSPAINPPPGLRCFVELLFLDAQGKILKSDSIPIQPNQEVHLDLDRNEIKDPATRVDFRGLARSINVPSGVAPPPSPPQGAVPPGTGLCISHFTLEVFDKDSGKTTVVLTDPKPAPWPLPSPTTQPPGLAR